MTEVGEDGARIVAGRYEIERELGRGGMAIVYLARDLRHSRRVALKVLSPELSQAIGADRFVREIEIASGLVHPHILPVFDSGVADGLPFYAMPFVEGESLRDRLNRETQLPVDDALAIARQVAAALSFAHGRGVIHRDIKPENVLLSGGEALVADFGIARAVTEAGGSRLTKTGIALGTPAYMSPEQASGSSDFDARSDQYSLGCVVYEMLAGEPPFTGPTAQAITARKISHQEASVALLRETVPDSVAQAIRKSLAPVPADRFATVQQFADELERNGTTAADTRKATAAPRSRRERLLLVGLGGAAALIALLGASLWKGRVARVEPAPVRAGVTLPSHIRITRGPGFGAPSIALSPDGRMLVIAGGDEQGNRLYRRPLDGLDVTPIAGTEGGYSPFFSPDGQWIGFFADGRIRRVPTAGGAVVDIARLKGFFSGASWGADGRIIFADGVYGPLYSVSVEQGDVRALTRVDSNEVGHWHPELLPDGRTVLFESVVGILVVDLTSGSKKHLVRGSAPRYASGHILFGRGPVLVAAPFDATRREITGSGIPLAEEFAADENTAHYAVSAAGSLVYLPGVTRHLLVLADGSGSETRVVDEPLAFQNPRFSPDGSRLAVARGRRVGEASDIWVHDLRTGGASRLTFDGGRAPVWTPDGTGVTYSRLGAGRGIYTVRADGRGEPEQVVPVDEFHWLIGWTPDGRTLAFGRMEGGASGATLSSIRAVVDGEVRTVIPPGQVWGGRLSPDGRWLAYYVMESSRFHVYVTTFPEGRGRWLVAGDGARDPSWGRDATRLYYRSGGRLMVAAADTTSGFRVVGRSVALDSFNPPLYDDYHVHPDGRRIVHVRPDEQFDREIILVLDWPAGLRRESRR